MAWLRVMSASSVDIDYHFTGWNTPFSVSSMGLALSGNGNGVLSSGCGAGWLDVSLRNTVILLLNN
jgi:hypothetical protein